MMRKYAVWIALLLTLAACYWVSMQDTENMVIAANSPQKEHARRPIDTRLPGLLSDALTSAHRNNETLILRSADLTPPKDLFHALAVPGNGAELEENQAPSSPANPYTYAGKVVEDRELTVFLTDGVNNFSVKAGEKLDKGWRLKRVQATELTLLFEPMGQEIIINTGAAL